MPADGGKCEGGSSFLPNGTHAPGKGEAALQGGVEREEKVPSCARVSQAYSRMIFSPEYPKATT